MGMFAVNVMYSVGLVIPVNLYGTRGASCGTFVIPLGTPMAASYGLFVGGKYAMVLYEMFIVGASLLSLKTGRTELPRRVEIMAHATCVAVGVGMFVGWTVYWNALFADMVSDAEGDTPAGVKALVHDNDEFTDSLMTILRVWVAVLAVVIGLWGWSRLVLRQLEREWDEALIDANQQWDRDREDSHMRAPVGSALPPPHMLHAQPRASGTFTFLRELCCHADWCTILSHVRPAPTIPAARLPFPVWNKRDPQVAGQRMQKRRLLDLRREGYREVAKPLEPCECAQCSVVCAQCMGAIASVQVRATDV